MLPLRYVQRWRIAGIIILALVLAASMMPAMLLWPDGPEFVILFIDTDKWLHGITFVFLTVWFSGQYRPGSYWQIGIGLMFFGVLIEACQRMVSYRSAEWFDIVADTLGIITGLLIAMAGIGGWSQRAENWYTRRRAGVNVD